jgi:ABC-type glycerol-3-phosphate transport system permease component
MAQATLTPAGVQSTPFYKTRRFGKIVHDAIVYFFLIVLGVLFAFPFFWMLSSALKTNAEVLLWPPKWIPVPAHWENFPEALFGNEQLPFIPTFLVNTLVIEAFTIIGRFVTCVLVAYAFARLNAPGRDFIFALLLATLMLPSLALLIPKFILFSRLDAASVQFFRSLSETLGTTIAPIRFVNSPLPLILPAYFAEAYAVFLFRQFFMTIPRELEEAMRMDGAGTLRIIFNLIVPLSLPVISVILIFTFKDVWNDFEGPLIYLNDLKKYTLSLGLAFFNGQFRVDMNLLMAANFAIMLPLIILFFIAQRAFVEGISMSGMGGR